MASPVVASVVRPPSVSSAGGSANSPAGGAVSEASEPADFATLLLAQVDAQEMLIADPAIAAATTSDASPESEGAVAAGGISDLANLLNATIVPPANQITMLPAANTALSPATDAATLPLAKAVFLPATQAGAPPSGQLADTIAAAGSGAAPGKGENDLLQSIGAARHSAIPPGSRSETVQPPIESVTAKFADMDLKLPAAITESSPNIGNMAASTASINVPVTARHPNAAADAAPATVRLDTPLDDARWSGDFGQRIVWLARQDVQVAQLTINPPNLGPVDVKLNLGGDQAAAIFTSPHADVREAIEAALPRLREMLAGAGISLGQTQVNSQSQQQSGNQGHTNPGEPRGVADGPILSGATDVNLSHTGRSRHGAGLVDTFA